MSIPRDKAPDIEKTLDILEENEKSSTYGGEFNAADYVDAPPDGGYGWLCAVLISFMNFSTWGANSAFSVFLAYFLESDYYPNATPTDYALIGGLVPCLTLLVLPYSAIMLYRFGYRITVSIGILVQLSAYLGASFATTIGQLYATQGVLMGISFGIIFGANSIVLPSWFLKKRAVANGVSHTGLGLGGITFSLSVNALLTKTGNQVWALRTLGIISFVICSLAMIFVKIRVPQNATFKKGDKVSIKDAFKKTFDYTVWKSLPLQFATAWASIANLGYTICLFSISNYARSLGYSNHQATIMIVVLCLGQTFGRPLMGLLSEYFGRVNFSMFCTFYICVFVFAIWPNISAYGSLIAFSFFLGLFIGVSSVNVVPLVVDVVGLDSYASALGWANAFMGLGSLISEVIALHLRDYTLVDRNPYFYCQMFVGSTYFIALLMLIPYRYWKVNRMLKMMRDSKNPDDIIMFQELHGNNTLKGYLYRAFLIRKV